MFTGIIEEIGNVRSFNLSGRSAVMTVAADKILSDAHLGDSISVDGVCVTITRFNKDEFTADLMPETVKATTLRRLRPGSRVNLERAMAADGRFGGHIVSGHVDAVAEVSARRSEANAIYLDLRVPPALARYIVEKGSVALDGTSLTVFSAGRDSLTVSLIPHTQDLTVLAKKKPGDLVNLECDLMAKYAERLLSQPDPTDNGSEAAGLGLSLLQENGFA
ncbi:riboflavin synthase [Bhargavaea ullalensis]|uniref:Riboflavin synthase n=1 Tax=Bhargavaea ullalensis TaxID=1265685 RepID=A0ABV2GA95_9BACL